MQYYNTVHCPLNERMDRVEGFVVIERRRAFIRKNMPVLVLEDTTLYNRFGIRQRDIFGELEEMEMC